MKDKCEWCLINSGRTHASRECCKLRRLAQAPRHVLLDYAKTLSEDEKIALRTAITDERVRLRGLK